MTQALGVTLFLQSKLSKRKKKKNTTQFTHSFESVHDGHHNVSFVVSLEVKEVDGTSSPKIDAWQPCKDRELETLW